MALTRIPRSMLNQPAPIRWTGTEAERLSLLPKDVINSDINYFYFQNDGKLFKLTSIESAELVWTAVKGAGAEGLENKLEKSDIEVTTGTGISISKAANSNLITFSGIDATTADKGVVLLAGANDIEAGTSTSKVITVAQLQAVKDNALVRGDITSATDSAINLDKTGTGNSIVISALDASDSQKGVVEIATDAEVAAGTSTVTVMTTKQVMDEVAKKLVKDFSSLTALSSISDSDVIAIYSGTESKKVVASDLKNYVINEIKQAKLFKGYYATPAALNAAWDGSTDKTPEAGSYAVVESTDSIWVYNSDATPSPVWEDTRIRGTVDVSTQIIAGTGLEGGGTLASDVTLNVIYGTTSGTACEGNDERLSRTAVAWTGDSTAFNIVVPTEAQEGFLFVVNGISSDTFIRRVYVCTNYEGETLTDKFTLIAEDPKVTTSSVGLVEGVLTAGTATITFGNVINNTYFDLYLSGIHQNATSYSVVYNDSNTVITLSESLEVDVDYSIVIYPFTKS